MLLEVGVKPGQRIDAAVQTDEDIIDALRRQVAEQQELIKHIADERCSTHWRNPFGTARQGAGSAESSTRNQRAGIEGAGLCPE